MTSGNLKMLTYLNLVAASAVVLLGGNRAWAALRDCDGRTVRDTTLIDSTLASRLDTAAAGTCLAFDLVL